MEFGFVGFGVLELYFGGICGVIVVCRNLGVGLFDVCLVFFFDVSGRGFVVFGSMWFC